MVVHMLRLVLAISVSVCCLLVAGDGGGPARNVYLTTQVIESEGYHAETHHATTTDGYIIEMHRIPFRRQESEAPQIRPVVLLMHGLLSASNGFIALGSEFSIAYNLADTGFDVWMGNARGNKNSRHHVTLDPDDNLQKLDFFDYSWEEVGMYDIAAMVDYILQHTLRDKLHYIGHSQGGTVFLVLNSMRPEYNAKFASAHLLAGVGYMDYFPNEALAELAQNTDLIYSLALLMGIVELYPPVPTSEELANYSKWDNCAGDISLKTFCEAIGVRKYVRNDEIEDLNPSSNDVGGGALKLVAHYGQNIRDKLFRRYRYGDQKNFDLYGSIDPPLYDLGLITVNTTMHYTISDDLLDERDVHAMVADMPNAVARRVARDSFLHGDFAVSPDVKELVTEWMIEAIFYMEEQAADDIVPDIPDETTEGNEGSPGSGSNVALNAVFKVYFLICTFLLMLKMK